MALKTKGTELYMVLPGSTPSLVKVGCPKGISGLGGSKPQIPLTCLDSAEQQFDPGMAAPGQMTVNLDYDPTKVSHTELWDMFADDTVTTWIVCASDGTAPPTISGDTVTYPTTRTFWSFEGYIADLPLDFQLNSVVKSTMQVQRSGARTQHLKS